MGLNFLRAKKEQYEQKRDASRLGIDVSDLWEGGNPDRVTELYSVELRDPQTEVIPGLRLLLKFDSESSAVVIQNAVVIGDLFQEDAFKLSTQMKAAGKATGMLSVLAAGKPDISGVFQVKIKSGKDIRKK